MPDPNPITEFRTADRTSRSARRRHDAGRARAPRTRTAGHRSGWCSFAASTSGDSSSTRTTRAARRASSTPTRTPRCAFTGRRSRSRSASKDRSSASAADESDAYFAGRPRGSQLGAWASAQSEILESREKFDAGVRRHRSALRGPAGSAPAVLGRVPHRSRHASSSGTDEPTGCTTGSSTCARGQTGRFRDCIHNPDAVRRRQGLSSRDREADTRPRLSTDSMSRGESLSEHRGLVAVLREVRRANVQTTLDSDRPSVTPVA